MTWVSPEIELQKAIYAALSAVGWQVLLGGPVAGVYDRVPANAAFPYVTIGDCRDVGDTAQGYDGSEIHVDVHVWSRAVGKLEAKTIAHAVRQTLAPRVGGAPPFALPNNQLVTWLFKGSDILADPDGLTTHGVVHLVYRTAPLS